ncbi:MAG: hypothetical protein COX44_02025 [Candidatus Portnoybacteria bacterium CG23_combo_of_CG06-09_8_20_14_all_37_13]|uniref:Uncharacterized protein n=2 Tax=Candidatus Portnoyibacteriota TaxID=1817913 RepID=A0A2M7BUL5_9BACT|nr:MAG: hypothetical protein COX44_02025 [Candidatus Portnoybacteria bacterium CG23_combo_of_CG06-09_8_20_14_all_37_13]PIV10229.1 MAG: hypothetical protein COS49_01665 [Candidatus Portnoybacteria bacterium CG03_land_8_20_14_0_80_41_10]
MTSIRCKACDYQIGLGNVVKSVVKKEGDTSFIRTSFIRTLIIRENPSFSIQCPNCGTWNRVKCRHKTGIKKTVRISSQPPQI